MIETFYRIPGAPSHALLTDLHNADPAPVIASLRRHAPSMICIAGDVLYGSHPEGDCSPLDTQENVLPFLRSCASIAPTFLSLGNHEWMLDDTDLAAITSTGVAILDNCWVERVVDDRKVVIGGLTSGYVMDYRRFLATLDEQERAEARYPKEHTSGIGGTVTASQHHPDTAWLQAFSATAPNLPHILLSHHPEYLPLVPPSVDLVLSGHAHGGQWRVFSHGVWCPGQGLWPKYTKGVYEGRLVVSAGLANIARVPRICNPTEAVYLESP